MMVRKNDELERMRAENARLVGLLETHGIAWREPEFAIAHSAPVALGTTEKIALFRRLFQGRTDVYPVRWESKSGKADYAPACANEWRAGVCEKPRVKCADCGHRMLVPLTDQTIYDHLSGRQTIGAYALLANDNCRFLAVDFDDADWRADAQAFLQSCRDLGVPAALEVSRSGNGAHAWVFFSSEVSARDARLLGTAIISHTYARTRQLKLESYDRLFPNQDTMPKGGFGNLIALPLQKVPRESGRSVFVNDALQPYADQWNFLASVTPMAPHDIEPTILRATGGSHPLDVTFITEEDQQEPWKRTAQSKQKIQGPMPSSLTVVQSNLLYFDKAQLSQALANRLIRLAAFQNPEFHKAQAMRLPVWNEPRVIGCAENFPGHIALPRGCLDAAVALLRENRIRCDLQDLLLKHEPTWLSSRSCPSHRRGELSAHFSDLPAAVLNDVNDLADTLLSPTFCGYAPANVITLLDASATRTAVLKASDELAARAGTEDTACIYFSGHGAVVGSAGSEDSVFLTVDSDLGQLAGTSISSNDFADALRQIKAKRLLVFIDACHAGGAAIAKSLTDGKGYEFKSGYSNSTFAKLAVGSGRALMASCRADELSSILHGARNSVFTTALLGGLRGAADKGGSGVIRVFDLFGYVSEEVPRLIQGDQHPIF